MSTGHLYGEKEPVEKCPYCDTDCTADWVDVGVGMIQCGPFHCDNCGASEIGANDDKRELTLAETLSGWYGPASTPGSRANVISGTIVDHKTMEGMYRLKFAGNPEYEKPGAVKDWLKKIREKPNAI